MSQTWENAQRRGVVALGMTAVGALGQQYQRAAYLAETQGAGASVAEVEAEAPTGESSAAGFSWLPYHAPAPSSVTSPAVRRAGGR